MARRWTLLASVLSLLSASASLSAQQSKSLPNEKGTSAEAKPKAGALRPGVKLARNEFPCLLRAFTQLSESGGREEVVALSHITDTSSAATKEHIAIKIDHKKKTMRVVTPSSLQIGRPEGEIFKIVASPNDVILGMYDFGIGSRNFLIDLKTSRAIETSSLRSGGDAGLLARSAFYECQFD